MSDDPVFIQFSRDQVERCDFRTILDIYSAKHLPVGPHLREMMNSLIFLVGGYDDDPLEIHAIPEIRTFYSAFHAAWPYWLFFCNLETETFLTMVLCCLPSMSSLKVDGRSRVAVEFDPMQLGIFLQQHFVPMNIMCVRAQMSERMIYDRTEAIFRYFNFPCDETPPP